MTRNQFNKIIEDLCTYERLKQAFLDDNDGNTVWMLMEKRKQEQVEKLWAGMNKDADKRLQEIRNEGTPAF